MIAIFPAISSCAASGDLERLAVLVREYFGGDGKFSPQLVVDQICRNVGIPVVRLAVDGVGALVAKDQGGRFEITAVINPHAGAYHERFLLAHLLGHYLLHVQPFIARGDWLMSGFRETQCSMQRFAGEQSAAGLTPFELKRELQADLFAAALLMPKGMVQRAMAKMGQASRVASFFDVSVGALTARLEGIAEGQAAPQNFLAAESQLKESASATIIKGQAATPQEAVKAYGKAQDPASSSSLSKGMQRLREIARRLDKSGDE